ncbi:hypothetical protein CVD28_25745 [Bacillus sp. M6-12]|uniref:hypothetical protein n=1 Tax=Bacillus sp. M6-12 TaxID=2054166 RepID=UPI000C78F728|nr:hypothetical protein [Bacillus sp. M6-12]PLS14923.1 hypothetical protein CVD28_25745 [Bacillus sp. M6-12]
MEKDSLYLQTVDRKGNPLTISVEGVDEQELAHFGGLDLHVNATKAMISDTNGMSFPEKEGDFLIKDKVAALYLNEIGEMLRNESPEPSLLAGITNIELVKEFLNQPLAKEVEGLIAKENDLIRKDKEARKKEEDEKWDNIFRR